MTEKQEDKILEQWKILNEKNQLALSQFGFFVIIGLIPLYLTAMALITALVHFW